MRQLPGVHFAHQIQRVRLGSATPGMPEPAAKKVRTEWLGGVVLDPVTARGSGYALEPARERLGAGSVLVTRLAEQQPAWSNQGGHIRDISCFEGAIWLFS